jgi:hypothetical protein
MSSRHKWFDIRLFVHVRICGSFLATMLLASLPANRCSAQLCAQLSGVNFTENFNSLAASGSSSAMPSEFSFVEAGTGGTLTYTADSGASTTGNTYSYGSAGSSERALGELTSSTVQSTFGACFVNNTNHAFTSFLIGYTGEEWRFAATGTVDKLDFQYSTEAGATLTSGTYINVDALDFNSPDSGAVGMKDGNASANRVVFAPLAITPASPIQPEQTFYIRWVPTLVSGANTNDGLAIDDFSIGATLAPGLATDYNNNNVADAADYIIWRKKLNQAVTIPNDITPGTVTAQDYVEWLNRYGKTSAEFSAGVAVPEPAIWLLMTAAASVAMLRRRRA